MEEAIPKLNYLMIQRHEFMRVNHREPEFYVMHPEMYYKIADECLVSGYGYMIDHMAIPATFRGQPVFRTTDIDKNMIRVG